MTTQAQPTEGRLSKLEGAYEQVNERLGDLTRGQDALREEIRQVDANLRAEMNSRFNEMNSRFNILLVLIGGVWATMVGGFIALFTRL